LIQELLRNQLNRQMMFIKCVLDDALEGSLNKAKTISINYQVKKIRFTLID